MLTDRISSGQFRPGERLGDERTLAAELHVSRAAVRQALAGLQETGMVRRVPGRGGGTFVAKGKIERDLSRIVGVPALLRSQGVVAGTRVLSARLAEPADNAAQALHTRPGELVVELPLGGSVYELIEEHFGVRPHHATERIEVTLAAPDEAMILDILPGAPLLAITRTVTDVDGEPVEFSRDLFRADRTRIVVNTEGSGSTQTTTTSSHARVVEPRVVELRAKAAG
jgi:GntR family transcriptional regulator